MRHPLGQITLPLRPGVLTCEGAMSILVYAQATWPDHVARADGYGDRWQVTITSATDTVAELTRLYALLIWTGTI